MNTLGTEARRAPLLAELRKLPIVTPTTPPPYASRRSTVTGSKSRGFTYEKRVGKVLDKICTNAGWKLKDHQWFKYTCGAETKYFQPDFIIQRPGQVGIVAEVKLTYVDTTLQLKKYLEYLDLFGLTCFPITIVRNLTPGVAQDLIVDDFTKVKPNSILHLWV